MFKCVSGFWSATANPQYLEFVIANVPCPWSFASPVFCLSPVFCRCLSVSQSAVSLQFVIALVQRAMSPVFE